MARMTVQHEPRVKGFTPIEVTYCWVEHREGGDVERSYTELVKSPAQEFTIDANRALITQSEQRIAQITADYRRQLQNERIDVAGQFAIHQYRGRR